MFKADIQLSYCSTNNSMLKTSLLLVIHFKWKNKHAGKRKQYLLEKDSASSLLLIHRLKWWSQI